MDDHDDDHDPESLMSRASKEAREAYLSGGGVTFAVLGSGLCMIGVRDGSVSTLRKFQEDARLGALAGSRAELVWPSPAARRANPVAAARREHPVAVITFADGARYVSRQLIGTYVGVAEKAIAAYNELAGFVPGTPGS